MRGNINHERRQDRDTHLPQGVRLNPKRRLTPYRAVITHDGERLHLGWFATSEEAGVVYEEARQMILAGEWDA